MAGLFTPSIPVLTYHSVGERAKMTPELFRGHLDALNNSGLGTILPGEFDSATSGAMVTFDDGFVDLWTHGFPLLKERGIKFTVFVITSRTGEGSPRPHGVNDYSGYPDDAHAEAARKPGPHDGFLRWSELELMIESGLCDVQSHSHTHAMGFVSDRVVGFNLTDNTHWSLIQATGGDERLGIPIHARGSAIGHRLYLTGRELRDRCAAYLGERGGAEYVAERGVQAVEQELFALEREVGDPGGGWEHEEERVRRTEEELVHARDVLIGKLGGRRDEFCLPWGHYDEVTLDCARRVGIKRLYTLDRGSNPAGAVGELVRRFEPRARPPGWLSTRLWLNRSTLRADLYAKLVSRG